MTELDILADDFSTDPWWWQAAPRPAPDPADELPRQADVVVVGSGYTGLAAALHLARAGRQVVILEADVPGFGASSRNAGFVGRTLKHSFGALLESHGEKYALRAYGEMREAYDSVFELVEREQMQCHLNRCGRFMAALSPTQYESMATELEIRRRYLGDEFDMVPRTEQHTEVGSTVYHGGAVMHDMGSIHPGLYHLELLDRVKQAGVDVIGNSPVTGLQPEKERVQVSTDRGTIQAREVFVATNGYTGPATPWMRRRIVPFHGYMIATEPLEPTLIEAVMPTDRTFHDYANNLTYVRRAPDEPRLLFGGLTGPEVASLQDKASHLRQRLLAVFPQLENTKLSRVWTGKCAGTFDLWPHLGEHDGIHFAMGYCFAGLPMGTHLGRKAAETIIDGRPSSSVFRDRPFKSHPLYFGNPWFLPWFMKWYDYQDRKAAAA